MKRDMDLVRQILFRMEENDGGYADPEFGVDGYAEDVVGHHVWLMEQAGLITAEEVTHLGSSSPIAIPLSVTWSGHDFLASVRNDTVWQKVKRIVVEKGGGIPFEVLQALAVQTAKRHFLGDLS